MRPAGWMLAAAVALFGAATATANATALALSAAPSGGVEPGVQIGGEVPSYLGLSLGRASGLTARSGEGASTGTLVVRVTASVPGAQLSLGGAEVGGGATAGKSHEAVGSPRLEASASGPFASIDTPLDAPLTQWAEPVSDAKATVRLRERASSGPRAAPIRGLLYLTLSATTP